jgi:protein-tyrosine phosphatase
MEKEAAAAVGIRYVAFPMSNSGKNSLEDMTDAAVGEWLQSVSAEIFADANQGGVAFHCSAGHDRSGIVSAWLRIKYENWPVDEAIAEMRRLGHNWVKYSHNGGVSSWHEDHLRDLAKQLDSAKNP